MGRLRKSFWFNALLVFLAFTVVYILFFAFLRGITNHGAEVKVPNVVGLEVTSAVGKLIALHFEISVDSTYEPGKTPLSVLRQLPDTAFEVKEGRTIFLTVNMLKPPMIPMPGLVNLTFRSAEMLLRNNKLLLGDTTMKPDIAAGAVLEQSFNGKPVKAGEMILQGSKISLLIGDGIGNTEPDVPKVTGLSVADAKAVLYASGLQYVFKPDDSVSAIADSSDAMITGQFPAEKSETGIPNRIKTGSVILLFYKRKSE